MKLKSITYRENIGRNDVNPWTLNDFVLENHNLIIAKNATGKTRILGVTYNLARLIQSPQVAGINGISQKNTSSGEWQVSFLNERGQDFVYSLVMNKGSVMSECITVNEKQVLKRDGSSAEIYSYVTDSPQSISPPNDRLVLHARRDQKEFPFLEDLSFWANSVKGLAFANTSPNSIEIPGNPFQLMSLNAVPSVLEQLSAPQQHKVLSQLHDLGYDLEEATTGLVEGLPPSARIVYVKERGLPVTLRQFEMSQGMFRAFSLLVIVEFFRSSGKVGCILIDDLGEGLDFDRVRKLANIIFSKQDQSELQIIATSNDAFLMNSVPLNSLTICHRKDCIVKCLNYSNSKAKFDEWKLFGLNNFDILSSNFLSD
jgi:hypothetical protein